MSKKNLVLRETYQKHNICLSTPACPFSHWSYLMRVVPLSLWLEPSPLSSPPHLRPVSALPDPSSYLYSVWEILIYSVVFYPKFRKSLELLEMPKVEMSGTIFIDFPSINISPEFVPSKDVAKVESLNLISQICVILFLIVHFKIRKLILTGQSCYSSQIRYILNQVESTINVIFDFIFSLL